MPKYHFRCDGICGREVVRLIASAKAKELDGRPCQSCAGIMRRAPRPPTAMVVERLDNGLMPRAVERPADAERLYHERARKDPSKD
jgi:hypothetical protein